MIIYKLTNKITSKVYIGQTRQTIEQRLRIHKNNKNCTALHRSIAKHGWENFVVEVLAEVVNLEELNSLEKEFIQFYDCIAPKGYNLTSGGKSYEISEVTRERKRLSRLGKTHTAETKLKISQSKVGNCSWDEARKKNNSGEFSHVSKLTNADVLLIKQYLKQNYTFASIAKIFHVSCSTISDIKTGKRWSNVN